MPDAANGLDIRRFNELKAASELGLNLWQSLELAADRSDAVAARLLCEQITVLTRTTIALVRRLGNPEPDTPFARDAKAWRKDREQAEKGHA